MTDKSKKAENLSDTDLDKVAGGFTATDDLANVKDGKGGKNFTATDDLARVKSGWKIEEGSAAQLKDAKDSGSGR